MKAYAYLRQGRPGKKAKIIQVEPRFSITASRSDKWIPIKPGTEGLLALGIAYVIIKESLSTTEIISKILLMRLRIGLMNEGKLMADLRS